MNDAWPSWRRALRGALVVGFFGLTCPRGSTRIEDKPYPPMFDPLWIKPTPAPAHFGVTLDCAIQVRQGALEILYRVTNHTGARYVVFNGVAAATPDSPQQVWVDFTGSALLVSKQIPPRPVTAMDAAMIPGQSLLEAGSTIVEQLTIPLPAVINNWMRFHGSRKSSRRAEGDQVRAYAQTARRRTNRITFLLGVMELDRDAQLFRSGTRSPVGGARHQDPELEQISLARTVILPETVEVLDYEEAAESKAP